MTATALLAFVLASVMLAITPGPGVVYIVTRTLAHGRAAGVASVAGVACGNFGNALGASLGLAALLAASASAFAVVKLAGAAYLIWLGFRALLAPVGIELRARPNQTTGQVFREGFVVALLNPKTAIFFAAFLPQFMHGRAPALPQAVAFGAAFVGIAACSDLAYALLASHLAPAFSRWRGAPKWGRWMSGGSLIALGAVSALSGRHE